MNQLTTLRIVEIGAHPYAKNAFPDQTEFFSTLSWSAHLDPDDGRRLLTLRTMPRLLAAVREADLIVCRPTFFSPWHWRWLIRSIFHSRILKGHMPLVSSFGPQFVRLAGSKPIAVIDHEDIPYIDRNNFFLLDRATLYFKRELPPDRWRLFTRTGHANLPTPRFRRLARYRARLEKVRPISLGLPLDFEPSPRAMEKTVDVFFAGLIDGSSSVRSAGLKELLALRERGVVVDIPEQRLPRAEFLERCARAWLTWSPEGLGWDCFRHYEAPACGSVPVINRPTVERYQPLRDREHALFYDVEHGELSRAVLSALADKTRLAAMAEAARHHVLAHHTAQALARHVVHATLKAAAGEE